MIQHLFDSFRQTVLRALIPALYLRMVHVLRGTKLHHGQSCCNRFAMNAVQDCSAQEKTLTNHRASIDVAKSAYH
jgi:hypothetical protein